MKLPKIDLPIFEAVLPSTGEKIKYRPFTVKEEKIMLIAKESKDPQQIILSVKQIIGNCLIDKDIDQLSVFDIEYILLMIRGKSVNNVVDFVIADPETREEVRLKLNIDEVKVLRNPEHSNKIKLNDDFMLIMKYPNYDLYLAALKDFQAQSDPLVYYDVIVSCLDQLVSPDTVVKFSEFNKAEVDEFMETLTGDIIEKIQKFFETMPKLRHELTYTNSNGNKKTYVIEGTESFFI